MRPRLFVPILCLALAVRSGGALALLPSGEIWGTNGPVDAIVVDETAANGPSTRLYVGGLFDYLGPSTGSGVVVEADPLNPLNASRLTTSAVFDGPVLAVVVDGSGGWFVGGAFSQVDGQARGHLVHLLGDGRVDGAWSADADAPVRALAVSGTRLYVGGDFQSIGGVARTRLAAVDVATGVVQSGWSADADGTVRALSVSSSGSTLYVGGDFLVLAGIERLRLAAIDLTVGVPTAWAPATGAPVRALSWQASRLMAGGDFASVGGVARRNLAAIDAATGRPLSWSVAVDGRVRALALSADGRSLFLGGDFAAVSGRSRSRLAAISTATGLALPWVGDADGRIDGLVLSDDGVTLFVGGEFTRLAGQPRSRLAQVRVQTGTVTFWQPAVDGPVRTLARFGKRLYFGGGFVTALGQPRPRIAAIDLDSLDLAPWAPRIDDGEVLDIEEAPDGGTVYVGGSFTRVAGNVDRFLAAFDQDQGQRIAAWLPEADAPVRSIVTSFDRSRLFVGGDFASLASLSRNRLASIGRFDASPSQDWIPDLDGSVRVMASDRQGVRLYVGGTFQRTAGRLQSRLAVYTAPPNETDPPRTTVSPPPGDYNGSNTASITLRCDDGNGSGCLGTYFTTDGSPPRAEPDFLYDTPISLNSNMTLRYFSVDRMGNREPEGQAVYHVDIEPPKTTAEPGTRVFFGDALTVRLFCDDQGGSGCAGTFYTLDGRQPDLASPRYTGPLTITGNVDLKFFSVDVFGNAESVGQESYVRNADRVGPVGPWAVACLLIYAGWRRGRR